MAHELPKVPFTEGGGGEVFQCHLPVKILIRFLISMTIYAGIMVTNLHNH